MLLSFVLFRFHYNAKTDISLTCRLLIKHSVRQEDSSLLAPPPITRTVTQVFPVKIVPEHLPLLFSGCKYDIHTYMPWNDNHRLEQ